jgi:hypothetical protein
LNEQQHWFSRCEFDVKRAKDHFETRKFRFLTHLSIQPGSSTQIEPSRLIGSPD